MARAYVQAKFETAPGFEGSTDTLSTKVLYPALIEAGLDLGVEHMARDDEMRGTDEPVPLIDEAYDPKWSWEGRLYPDLAGWLLKAIFGSPVSTAGDGIIVDPDAGTIPAGANRHVWTAPYGPAGVSPQTMQCVFGYVEQGVFWRVKGMAVDELEITTPEKGGARFKVSGEATYAQKIADPVLTPAPEAIAIRPFTRSGLTLPSWLAGTGKAEDYSTKVENPVEYSRTLGAASKSRDTVEKGEGVIAVMGDVPKRQIDPEDIDALIAATGFAAKAKWLNESIAAGAYKHTLWQVLSNVQYQSGNPDALSNKRRHGATFGFKASNAGTASAIWTLVNATLNYS